MGTPARLRPAYRDIDCNQPTVCEPDGVGAVTRAAVSMAAAILRATHRATASHCDDVVLLCGVIADELALGCADRAELFAAAQLHDIGKVAVAHDVLNKRGALNDHQWALIRQHTVVGEQIIGAVPELAGTARLVRHSHERWDGGGYPDGLARTQIPLASRIIFCADAFHAIRLRMSIGKCRSVIIESCRSLRASRPGTRVLGEAPRWGDEPVTRVRGL